MSRRTKDNEVSVARVASFDPALAPAFAAAREICRRHARGFYFASFFLPLAKRQAAHSVYAFCQMIDEAIDVPDESLHGAKAMRQHPAVVSPRALPVIRSSEAGHCEIDSLESRISMLRDRLDEIYDGRLELPAPESRSQQQHALYAFAHTIARYEIPRQYFLDLVEGCRMDLTTRRYETWKDLEDYCYHVAGVVGLMMSCVFGMTNSGAFSQAIAMGNAMQLTNILQDLKPDWEHARLYLPQEDLRRFDYTENELSRQVVNDNFRALMRFEVERARQMYRSGADAICWLAGDGSRLTASAMAIFYAGILDVIERHDYDVFSKRPDLTTVQKFRRLPTAWRLARRRPDEPLPRQLYHGFSNPCARLGKP